jgi:hypothetical protein
VSDRQGNYVSATPLQQGNSASADNGWLVRRSCTAQGHTGGQAARGSQAAALAFLVPGDSWQQRWLACDAKNHSGASWVQLPLAWLRECGQSCSIDQDDLPAGLLMLICGDAIRPGLPWLLTRTHCTWLR